MPSAEPPSGPKLSPDPGPCSLKVLSWMSALECILDRGGPEPDDCGAASACVPCFARLLATAFRGWAALASLISSSKGVLPNSAVYKDRGEWQAYVSRNDVRAKNHTGHSKHNHSTLSVDLERLGEGTYQHSVPAGRLDFCIRASFA